MRVEIGQIVGFLEKCFNFRVLRLFRNVWQMEDFRVWESLRVLRVEKGQIVGFFSICLYFGRASIIDLQAISRINLNFSELEFFLK